MGSFPAEVNAKIPGYADGKRAGRCYCFSLKVPSTHPETSSSITFDRGQTLPSGLDCRELVPL